MIVITAFEAQCRIRVEKGRKHRAIRHPPRYTWGTHRIHSGYPPQITTAPLWALLAQPVVLQGLTAARTRGDSGRRKGGRWACVSTLRRGLRRRWLDFPAAAEGFVDGDEAGGGPRFALGQLGLDGELRALGVEHR